MRHSIGGARRQEAAGLRVAIDIGNEVLARGLEDVLRGVAGVGAVRRCRSRAEAGMLAGSGETDVIILTGAETGWLGEVPPGAAGRSAKVLVLLDQTEAREASLLASMGADGFLVQQEITAESLGESIERMVRGEVPMPARLARELLSRAGSPPPERAPRPVRLTAREQETLNLLAEGLSNKQIARRLGISDHGAKRLVTSVLLKLGAPNRTAAVVTAIRSGMVGEPSARNR